MCVMKFAAYEVEASGTFANTSVTQKSNLFSQEI